MAGVLPAALIAGCGMPGAPQPPSLNLPARVNDLSAVRTGGQVALAWTMPARTTDKVTLKGPVTVRICRSEADVEPCAAVRTVQLQPGANGVYRDALPQPLLTGQARVLHYAVELVNRRDRSAGVSNIAVVPAGATPSPVTGLGGEVRRDGVLLHWTPQGAGETQAVIRLERTLLNQQDKKQDDKSQGSVLAAPEEPAKRTLLVQPNSRGDRALDSDVHFGRSYEYRAQRVVEVNEGGQKLELTSEISPPVRIEVADIFPPSVPRGLAAVATGGENGNAAAIDLSWMPDSDADLAGYAVYREDLNGGGAPGAWARISPTQPLAGPGYHDDHVVAGHTYVYSVTAIGQNGQESARSQQTQETVPEP